VRLVVAAIERARDVEHQVVVLVEHLYRRRVFDSRFTPINKHELDSCTVSIVQLTGPRSDERVEWCYGRFLINRRTIRAESTRQLGQVEVVSIRPVDLDVVRLSQVAVNLEAVRHTRTLKSEDTTAARHTAGGPGWRIRFNRKRRRKPIERGRIVAAALVVSGKRLHGQLSCACRNVDSDREVIEFLAIDAIQSIAEDGGLAVRTVRGYLNRRGPEAATRGRSENARKERLSTAVRSVFDDEKEKLCATVPSNGGARPW
jgi:hypothetical protein